MSGRMVCLKSPLLHKEIDVAKIHVLEGGGNQGGIYLYRVVVHTPTPAGNNLAGTSWIDAVKNSGTAESSMTPGVGPGQITNSELNNIQNGTVIEGTFVWGDDPTWTNAQRQADLDLRANQMVAELLTNLQHKLNYFGFTRS